MEMKRKRNIEKKTESDNNNSNGKNGINDDFGRSMPILLCNLTRYKTYNQINDKN